MWWLVNDRDVSDTDRRSPATTDLAPTEVGRETPPEAPESDDVDRRDPLTDAIEDVAEGWEDTDERLEA